MKIYHVERIVSPPMIGLQALLRAEEMGDFFSFYPNAKFKVTTLHSDDEHFKVVLDGDVTHMSQTVLM